MRNVSGECSVKYITNTCTRRFTFLLLCVFVPWTDFRGFFYFFFLLFHEPFFVRCPAPGKGRRRHRTGLHRKGFASNVNKNVAAISPLGVIKFVRVISWKYWSHWCALDSIWYLFRDRTSCAITGIITTVCNIVILTRRIYNYWII